MDIQRTILWVVFSVSLIFLWDNWQRYQGHPSLFFAQPVNSTSQSGMKNGALPATAPNDIPAPIRTNSNSSIAHETVPATQASLVAKPVTIHTDVLNIDIDLNGATITRTELLRYQDDVDATKKMVLLDSSPQRIYLAQSGLISNTGGLPTHRTPFQLVSDVLSLGAGQDQLTVTFEAQSNGVRLLKTYTFKRGRYDIDVQHQITNLTSQALTPQLYLQLVRDGNNPPGGSHFYSTFTGPAVYTAAEKFQKESFDDIAKGKVKHATQSSDGWIAMVQHYFVSAWIPREPLAREIYTQKIDTNLYRVGVKLALPTLAPGATATNHAQLFIGPQEERLLEKVAPGLELVRDYGWLTILAKPLFWLLEKFHALLGNWGWAIVALTVLLKLIFFPLSAASYKSMARMKLVAPRLKAIQDRHKGDRAKMNQAMMELYRTEKINPMGGCLPILVQIPVFIALYWTLLASVEMRNAPWIGWIHDLAQPDPWYILPLIMMGSMFVQYKLNPAPPDPLQAKLMLFMPLVFGVMFFFFPAGLVLYWVVNNILSIAQQWQITRLLETGKEK